MISKQPKLQRQKRIFKQVMPRAKQMNINIVTWGRWMKQSSRIPSRTNVSIPSNEVLHVSIKIIKIFSTLIEEFEELKNT